MNPPAVPLRKRVAILISGRGSNMSALIEAARQPGYPAQIVGVISNRADAEGLKTAQNLGLSTTVHSLKDYPDKTATDEAITRTLESWDVDMVCLAGFMRILSAEFTLAWQGRLMNIHPSLLPKFKGTDTHRRAIEAGEKTHGCTVHFVVPELDAGPVIAQSSVPVLPGDTPETLAQRVLSAEHRLYPQALKQVLAHADTGELQLAG